jgi:cephalosporin hydroxylase
LITLIEGNAVSPATVQQVQSQIQPGEKVLVILDSCHSREHVAAELAAYSPLVTPGSYIVVTDGLMQGLAGLPRAPAEWSWDNPQTATREFLAREPAFALEEPALPFNEGAIRDRVTHWPSAYLRRCA